MKKEKLLVSACLLGIPCRYDGQSKEYPHIDRLKEKYELVPVCPEVMGGLSIPREAGEIKDRRVLTKDGESLSFAYATGARAALSLAFRRGCTKALLKEKSPSCGSGKIYDGSFSRTLTDGDGVTAALLKKYGIKVYGETEAEKLL